MVDRHEMISPQQIRAARGLTGLSQEELAERADIGIATLRRIEAIATGTTGNIRTLMQIRRALQEAGVEFIDETKDKGPGVRLKFPLGDEGAPEAT